MAKKKSEKDVEEAVVITEQIAQEIEEEFEEEFKEEIAQDVLTELEKAQLLVEEAEKLEEARQLLSLHKKEEVQRQRRQTIETAFKKKNDTLLKATEIAESAYKKIELAYKNMGEAEKILREIDGLFAKNNIRDHNRNSILAQITKEKTPNKKGEIIKTIIGQIRHYRGYFAELVK